MVLRGNGVARDFSGVGCFWSVDKWIDFVLFFWYLGLWLYVFYGGSKRTPRIIWGLNGFEGQRSCQ